MSGQRPNQQAGGRNGQAQPTSPRRVRNGVRLRQKEGVPTPANWIARKFGLLLEKLCDSSELMDGLADARSGQTVSLIVDAGRISARVQGFDARPAEIAIEFDTWDEVRWESLIDSMSAEAIHVARLLDGDVPESLALLFEASGVEVVPSDASQVRVSGSPKSAPLGRHLATILYIMVERLSQEPMLAFTLRGMSGTALMDRLRQARAMRTHGVASAHGDPAIPATREAAPGLEDCIEDFWRPSTPLGRLRNAPRIEHRPHALLRRLGPSPMEGKFPLVGLLASIYDEVAEHARKSDVPGN